MTRPKWRDYFLEIAKAVALRADCSRRQVGCLIVRPDKTIVATGYNGGPAGGPSCLMGECPRGRLSTEELAPGSSYDTGAGACIALHAEQNALLRASWDEMQGSTLYCTDKPCDGCWRMIAGSPIQFIVWPEEEPHTEYFPDRPPEVTMVPSIKVAERGTIDRHKFFVQGRT